MKEPLTCSSKPSSSWWMRVNRGFVKTAAFKSIRMLVIGAAIGAPFVSYARSGSSSLNERKDIAAALHKIVCVDREKPSPKTLWAQGVYDAQVEGFVSTDTPDFKNVAKSIAAGRLHGGFAASKCEDGREVSASVPSRVPIALNSSGRLCVPLEVRKQCRGVSVDFAAAAGGIGNQLELNDGCADLSRLKAGIVAVTCLPKLPRWKGPEAFYYVPVKGGPEMEVPLKQLLSASTDEKRSIGNWINALRLRETLLPISFGSTEMAASADRLSIGASLVHDRGSIKSEKDALKVQGVSFIGEDRAIGSSIEEIGWQLYNSPRHRRLLLDSKANLGAVVVKNHANGRFVLVTIGSKSQLNISRSR